MNIPNHNFTEREKSIVKLFNETELSNIKTFLNIGFRNWNDLRNHWWIKICEENNIDWKIVEIFEKNVKDALISGCPKDKIFEGNILNVDSLPETDCIFFWHGWEHLLKKDAVDTIKKLELKYKYLVFGMPLGEEPQGEIYGNPHEKHISSWTSNEWKSMGYNVIEVHDGRKYSHITVYKFI